MKEHTMDAWQEMENWCARQAQSASVAFAERYLEGGFPLDDPELRRLLGESHAFGRMRSYIHGARKLAA